MRLLLSLLISLVLGVSVHGAAGSDTPPTKITSSNSTVTVVFDQTGHIYDLSVATSGGATNGIQQLNGFGTNTTFNGTTTFNGARVDTNYVRDMLSSNIPAANVRAFGAKGDGITDDTVAIQATVIAAGTNTPIYLPAGSYLVTNTILLTGPQEIYGAFSDRPFSNGNPASTGTILVSGITNGDPVIKCVASGSLFRGVSIRNIAIQGTGTDGDGIYVDAVTGTSVGINCANIKFSGVTVKAVGGSGFHCYYYGWNNVLFENVTAMDCGGDGYLMNDIYRTGGSGRGSGQFSTWINAQANGCTGYGFDFSQVSRTTFIGCKDEGCLAGGWFWFNGRDNVLMNCQAEPGGTNINGITFSKCSRNFWMGASSSSGNAGTGYNLQLTNSSIGNVFEYFSFAGTNTPVVHLDSGSYENRFRYASFQFNVGINADNAVLDETVSYPGNVWENIMQLDPGTTNHTGWSSGVSPPDTLVFGSAPIRLGGPIAFMNGGPMVSLAANADVYADPTTNTAALNITNNLMFLDVQPSVPMVVTHIAHAGNQGQLCTLRFANTNTTLIHSAGSLCLQNSANWNPVAGSMIVLTDRNGSGGWFEVCRSDKAPLVSGLLISPEVLSGNLKFDTNSSQITMANNSGTQERLIGANNATVLVGNSTQRIQLDGSDIITLGHPDLGSAQSVQLPRRAVATAGPTHQPSAILEFDASQWTNSAALDVKITEELQPGNGSYDLQWRSTSLLMALTSAGNLNSIQDLSSATLSQGSTKILTAGQHLTNIVDIGSGSGVAMSLSGTNAATIGQHTSDNSIATNGYNVPTIGKGITIKAGANGKLSSTAETLSGGTVTINNTAVTANSKIFLTPVTISPVSGVLGVTTITANTSFVVTSSNNLDTNQFNWFIVEAQ